MKNISIMANEIHKGKNIEENLSHFSKKLTELYYEFSLLNLTMNYYTLYEMIQEGDKQCENKVQVLLDSIHGIMQQSIFHEFDGQLIEDSVKKLDGFRSNIEMAMQVLTNYMDILQNYEYVLNRMEPRFVQDSSRESIVQESSVQDIVRYLFAEKDNVIVNGRIKEVLGQLPVRMTRGKFFELIENSFTLYKEADNASIDSFLYILRNSAMLDQSEEMAKEFPLLDQIVNNLEQADYKNLTSEEYYTLTKQLHEGAEYIRNMVDIYISCVEIVNRLYVVLLSTPYIMSLESKEEKACKEILQELNKGFLEQDYEVDFSALILKLEVMEGRQEMIAEDIPQYEGLLLEISTVYQDLIKSFMLEKIFNGLYASQVLLSSSYFAPIGAQDIQKCIDGEYLKKVTGIYIEELNESFKNRSQVINRAVMANIMSKLPVFFRDTEEVIEYINDVFEKCNDEAEKLASIYIIKQLIQEN